MLLFYVCASYIFYTLSQVSQTGRHRKGSHATKKIRAALRSACFSDNRETCIFLNILPIGRQGAKKTSTRKKAVFVSEIGLRPLFFQPFPKRFHGALRFFISATGTKTTPTWCPHRDRKRPATSMLYTQSKYKLRTMVTYLKKSSNMYPSDCVARSLPLCFSYYSFLFIPFVQIQRQAFFLSF